MIIYWHDADCLANDNGYVVSNSGHITPAQCLLILLHVAQRLAINSTVRMRNGSKSNKLLVKIAARVTGRNKI